MEENDALLEGEENGFIYEGNRYPARVLCDLMHLQGAAALSVYEEDFYAKMPVITKNRFGKGCAYYVGTRSNPEFYYHFLEDVFRESNVVQTMVTPKGVEASVRVSKDREILFLLNHNAGKESVRMNYDYVDLLNEKKYPAGAFVDMNGKDVRILQKQPGQRRQR